MECTNRVLKERHLLLAVCLRQHGAAPSVPGWRRCGDVELMSWVFHRQQNGKAFLSTLTFAFTNAGFCPHEWLQTPNQVLLVVTRMYPDGNFYHKYKNVMQKKKNCWCRNQEKTTPQTTWKYNVWPTFSSLTNVHRSLSGTYEGPRVAATSLSLLPLFSQYRKSTDLPSTPASAAILHLCCLPWSLSWGRRRAVWSQCLTSLACLPPFQRLHFLPAGPLKTAEAGWPCFHLAETLEVASMSSFPCQLYNNSHCRNM